MGDGLTDHFQERRLAEILYYQVNFWWKTKVATYITWTVETNITKQCEEQWFK